MHRKELREITKELDLFDDIQQVINCLENGYQLTLTITSNGGKELSVNLDRWRSVKSQEEIATGLIELFKNIRESITKRLEPKIEDLVTFDEF